MKSVLGDSGAQAILFYIGEPDPEYERIEDEQSRLQPGDGLIETCAVGLEIEAQTGRCDHLDVEFGEANTGGGADSPP